MEAAINGFGNLKGLVLDLRENPGGLLNQAVDVCDHLLTKGQTIVTQRGRAYSDVNYTATHGNGGKTFPIVVSSIATPHLPRRSSPARCRITTAP